MERHDMKPNYGKILFWFFLIVLALFIVLGFGAGIAAVFGYVDWKQGSVGAVMGGVGTALGVQQIKLIYFESLRRELLPSNVAGRLEEQLKDYFRNRLGTVPGAGEIKDERALEDISKRLMQQFLCFLESVLRIKSPNILFEISVFANVKEPTIICYYDSGGSTKPSSANLRDANAQFYRENKYEAVELLERPNSNGDVMVISRTEKTSTYSFRDAKQKARIKSTCLCSFSDPEPIVIVLVANRSKVFDESDAPLKSLVTAALMSVAYERKIIKAIKMANPG
jgi:hypothetical protein